MAAATLSLSLFRNDNHTCVIFFSHLLQCMKWFHFEPGFYTYVYYYRLARRLKGE